MGVHFYGPLHLIRAAIPHMRRQGGGRIVNIASIGGKVAIPHLLPYCASKFALVGLSDGLRAELARDRIAVTTIVPGLMRTGSHLNARFRGHHKREFAWFALADALPLTSMDVDRAAAKIVEATRQKRARLIISIQAKTLAWLDAHGAGAGRDRDGHRQSRAAGRGRARRATRTAPVTRAARAGCRRSSRASPIARPSATTSSARARRRRVNGTRRA